MSTRRSPGVSDALKRISGKYQNKEVRRPGDGGAVRILGENKGVLNKAGKSNGFGVKAPVGRSASKPIAKVKEDVKAIVEEAKAPAEPAGTGPIGQGSLRASVSPSSKSSLAPVITPEQAAHNLLYSQCKGEIVNTAQSSDLSIQRLTEERNQLEQSLSRLRPTARTDISMNSPDPVASLAEGEHFRLFNALREKKSEHSALFEHNTALNSEFSSLLSSVADLQKQLKMLKQDHLRELSLIQL